MKKLIITILKTIIFFIGWAVTLPLYPDIPVTHPAFLRLWYEFTPFISILIFTVIFILFVERRNITIPMFSNTCRNTLIGLGTGIVWLGSTVLLLLILGIIKFDSINNVSYIWIWILASLLNVAMQEFLVRGYLYQLYKNKYNIIVATIVTTALFTVLHGGAFEVGIIAVLNVFTMSLFVSVLLEYTETLLAPILVHFTWNTIGAIILGGVTLAEDYPNVLNCSFSGNNLLSGGAYKMEGSIVVLIINIALIAFFLSLINKKNTSKKGRAF